MRAKHVLINCANINNSIAKVFIVNIHIEWIDGILVETKF